MSIEGFELRPIPGWRPDQPGNARRTHLRRGWPRPPLPDFITLVRNSREPPRTISNTANPCHISASACGQSASCKAARAIIAKGELNGKAIARDRKGVV